MLISQPLEIFGVYDRGIPNLERVVLRASEAVDLRLYGVMLGWRGPQETILPIPDQFIWLGATQLQVPSWIFIFTGPGNPGISKEQHTQDPIHALYWNKPYAILADPEIVPALVRFDTVVVNTQPPKSIADLTTDTSKRLNEIVESIMKSIQDKRS